MNKLSLFVIIFLISASILLNNFKSITLGNVSVYELGSVSIGFDGDEKNSILNSQIVNNSNKVCYAVDKKTGMPSNLFDTAKMASENLHINIEGTGAKILIFHTHGSEMFADSKNVNDGVIGAGEYLKSILEDKYGVECIHITDRFDVVDGKLKRDGAYERAEPVITQVLKENPSIQLVIDLHRDGVNENIRLVTEFEGKKYAKIMFFNGICTMWDNGELVPIEGLENPYIKTNLALSYQMQEAVLDFNCDIARKIYINAYRYSLHMKDKSMLIELGAQTNTVEEVNNSVEVIAEAIGKVCL